MHSTKSILSNANNASYSFGRLIVGALFLLLCGVKLTWNFNRQVDISFDDEVRYMRYGLDLFGQIHNDWDQHILFGISFYPYLSISR